MQESLDSFRAIFEAAGYQPCDSQELEPGFEKVAIYVDAAGEPTHAARQVENGNWTSKLGRWEDIEHSAPSSLEGVDPAYGTVALILRRRRVRAG